MMSTYAGDMPGRTELGCLDVSLAPGWRQEAAGPIVVYDLGNRCEHSIRVDLGALRVVGRDELDHEVDMVPFDPDHEIEPRTMDARARGEEWIEYHPRFPGGALRLLRVDVGGIAMDEPPQSRWIDVRP
jgi:hypothetical protein